MKYLSILNNILYGDRPEIEKHIEDWLEQYIIEPSESPCNSLIFLVPKKPELQGNSMGTRLVTDLRRLNLKVIDQEFPIPTIQEILDQLQGCKYFSCLDLYSGFLQILLDPKDREKVAFSTHLGHYQFKRLPFGLKSSPKFFMKILTNAVKGIPNLRCYIDDLVIFTKDLASHIKTFEKVMDALRKVGPNKKAFAHL